MLLLTALIWGTAFVAQRTGVEFLGPCSFVAIRSLLGFAVLLPFVLLRFRSGKAALPSIKSAALCGLAYTLGATLQQAGLAYTTAGKAGFISTLYVVLVPLIGLVLGRKPRPVVWLGAALSVFGLYLMSSVGSFSLGLGEVLVLISSFCYAAQIMLVDHYVMKYDGIALSCWQFAAAALFTLPVSLLFEHPVLSSVWEARWTLLYTGVMSSGVAFTLQILGQKRTPAALASLIMSLESVFSALAGALILGERLTGRELIGCALMFGAVLLLQLSSLRRDEPRS